MAEGAAQSGPPTIWKQTHRVDDVIVLELPEGSTLLDVGDQQGGGALLDFWFFVPDARAAASVPPPVVERKIGVLGTGHIVPKLWCANDYWKTVVTAGGALVWHVFKEGKG